MSGRTYDYLIIGAGFAGSVLAERLANSGNIRILLIDKRPHIGGNAFDHIDKNGILIHKYGPHIFHTNSERIYNYLSRYTEWRFYEHRVKTYVREKYLPFPININTVNSLYNLHLSDSGEFDTFLASLLTKREAILSIEDYVVSKVGQELYELFFKNYSKKQWGVDPSTLAASIAARIPVRNNFDDRYFTDKYQFMPLHGYTKLFERLLGHHNIDVSLGINYENIKEHTDFKTLIFTGPVDSYFSFEFGKLKYRSLDFTLQTFDQNYIQDVAVYNYPNNFDYTRTTEFKYLTGQIQSLSTIMYEYPSDEGEPYYPINNKESRYLYSRYKQLAKSVNKVYFVGRLGTYQYLNMDQVVAQSLSLFEFLKNSQ